MALLHCSLVLLLSFKPFCFLILHRPPRTLWRRPFVPGVLMFWGHVTLHGVLYVHCAGPWWPLSTWAASSESFHFNVFLSWLSLLCFLSSVFRDLQLFVCWTFWTIPLLSYIVFLLLPPLSTLFLSTYWFYNFCIILVFKSSLIILLFHSCLGQ